MSIEKQKIIPLRTIKSWTKREVSLSPAAAVFMTEHACYSKDAKTLIEKVILSGCKNIILDIGCGDGQSLLDRALFLKESKKEDYLLIGAEPHTPGIFKGLQRLDSLALENVHFFHGDVLDLLAHWPKDNFLLETICIYFADPWQKTRHHKRRLIQQTFLEKIYPLLSKEGVVHIATDWEPYALFIEEELHKVSSLFRVENDYPKSAFRRVATKYERKAQREGREVREFFVYKKDSPKEEK